MMMNGAATPAPPTTTLRKKRVGENGGCPKNPGRPPARTCAEWPPASETLREAFVLVLALGFASPSAQERLERTQGTAQRTATRNCPTEVN